MNQPPLWTIATILVGLGAGWAVASLSARMGELRRNGLPRAVAISGLAGALAAWAALALPGPLGFVSALLGWWLLLLAVLDAEQFWLPDILTLPLIAAGLAATAAIDPGRAVDSVIGAALGYGLLRLVAEGYRRWRGREGLGGGDAKLLAAAGAWVGWIGLPSVLVWGAATGLAVVAIQAGRRRQLSWTQAIPFGVFLALGTWITWLYGPIGR